MPRNSQGTYSLPNPPLQDGTNILVAPHNQNYSDLATEVTNSLDRAGRGGMAGQFKAVNGSQSQPGISYSQDTDTGWRRSGTNQQTAVCGGQDIFDITPDGVVMKAGKNLPAFPAGTKMLFIQTAAPTGWTKDTTHNNKALRIVSGTAGSGGSTAFTSVFTSRTISVSNLPSHTHGNGTLATSSAGAHTHTLNTRRWLSTGAQDDSRGMNASNGPALTLTTSSDGAHTHSITGSTGSAGSGTAMDFAVAYVDAIIATKD